MPRIFLLSVSYCFVFFSLSAQQVPAYFGGGAYSHQEKKSCLSPEQRKAIQARLAEQVERLGLRSQDERSTDLLLGWPVQQSVNYTEWKAEGISNYVDLNPAFPDRLLDYNCGNRSYDLSSGYNHQGVDVFSWPYPWRKMDNEELEIIAAAEGTIILKQDGNDDKSCDLQASGDWNAVYVQHDDGSIAWYGHMKRGSLTKKAVGERVRTGEFLGIMGSSGRSSGPHLHLELYDAEGNLIEPFDGPCNNTTDRGWWKDQPDYREPVMNGIITHNIPPDPNRCYANRIFGSRLNFTHGQALFLGSYYRDEMAGMTSQYRIYRPNGSLFALENRTPSLSYNASWWYYGYDLPVSGSEGQWTIEIDFDGVTYSQHFYLFSQLPTLLLQTDKTNLDFGTIALGLTHTTSFTLSNPGSGGITVDSIRCSSDQLRAHWDGFLHTGMGKEIVVSFTPEEDRPYSETVVIYSDAAGSPHTVTVTATGSEELVATPTAVDFGDVSISGMQTQSIAWINQTNQPIQLETVEVPGSFSADFTTQPVMPQASQTIDLTFAPDILGDVAGTVRLLFDTLAGEVELPVSGRGVGAVLRPDTELAFGDVEIGTEVMQTATLRNEGNVALNVSDIQFPEGFSGNWTSGAIPPADSQLIEVTFSPEDLQAYVGDLVISSDAVSGPNRLTLSGTGIMATSLTGSDSELPLLSIFPNPATERALLHLSQQAGLPEGDLHLLSPEGKRLNTWALPSSGSEVTIQLDLVNLPAGVYSVQLSTESRPVVKQLVVR